MWAPFERQKTEIQIFERTNLSGLGTWKFTAKEELNPQKQVFLLNLRLWPVQKPKIWSFFYRKTFIWKNSVEWKLRAFVLKLSTFTSSAYCSYPCCRVPCRICCFGLVADMWHLKRSSISSFNLIITNPKSWHVFSG